MPKGPVAAAGTRFSVVARAHTHTHTHTTHTTHTHTLSPTHELAQFVTLDTLPDNIMVYIYVCTCIFSYIAMIAMADYNQ